jgi:hypothetical protein
VISTAGPAEERKEGILGQLIDGNEDAGELEQRPGLTVSRNPGFRVTRSMRQFERRLNAGTCSSRPKLCCPFRRRRMGAARGSDELGTPVVQVRTQETRQMAELCSRFYAAVVTDGLSHDGNPGLAAHLANTVVRERSEGAVIQKEDRHSNKKIDLAVAAVLAFGRAAVAEPRQASGSPDPRPKVPAISHNPRACNVCSRRGLGTRRLHKSVVEE